MYHDVIGYSVYMPTMAFRLILYVCSRDVDVCNVLSIVYYLDRRMNRIIHTFVCLPVPIRKYINGLIQTRRQPVALTPIEKIDLWKPNLRRQTQQSRGMRI